MQPTLQTVVHIEYDKLVESRKQAVKLLEKIDKQLAKLRGIMNDKY